MKKCLQEVIFKKSLISSFFLPLLGLECYQQESQTWLSAIVQSFSCRDLLNKLSLVITIEQTVLSSSNKNYKIDKISKLEKYRKMSSHVTITFIIIVCC